MFRDRRRKATSNPPLNGFNANPSAASAAAQAFLRNRSSNTSLSAAAAAAALKARPTTPTSVADVETKRTLRRNGSVSSMGSSAGSAGGRPTSQLERRLSSGSMSERTFRESSPGAAGRSQPVPSAADAPPVPPIPNNLQQGQAQGSSNSHRRAASQEGMRVASPPPNQAGRGSSLGPMLLSSPARRSGQRMTSLSSVQELMGERPASRGSVNSINFSLPTVSRTNSPISQRRLTSPGLQRPAPRIVSNTNQDMIYDPNTRSFLPLAEIHAIEQRINDAANVTVKKKKRIIPKQTAGTHLAEKTVGGRLRGTAIVEMEAAASQQSAETQEPTTHVTAPKEAQRVAEPTSLVQAPEAELVALAIPYPSEPPVEPTSAPLPTTTTTKRRKKKRVVVSDSDSDQGSYIPNSSDNDSDLPFRPTNSQTRGATMLVKKPSIVREDREREEEEDDTPKRTGPSDSLPKLTTGPRAIRPISPTPLPRSSAGRGHGRGQALASAALAQNRQHTRSASQPAPDLADSPTALTGVGLVTKDSIRNNRVQSVSPARTTHFAPSPDNLLVKHQPPPRSISPRKSALKHSNSPRGPSPASDVGAAGQGQVMSEGSNASTVGSEELAVPLPKKRANRVSFDETNVVVGQAAAPVSSDSPVVQSPPVKSKWYSIGRGKKKQTSISDEDDEVMKPRPALPSFGSVREKKNTREVEERPLVKPADPSEPKQPLASPPPFTTPTVDVIEYPMGQSNDHLVGAVISQDAASKNTANISKSREPLPPQVTSVEGSGYHSDSDSSDYSLNNKTDLGVVGADSVKRGPEDGNTETHKALASPVPEPEEEQRDDDTPTPTLKSNPMDKHNGDVPEITIVHATPTLDASQSKTEWLNMPGAWDASDSESQQEEDSLPEMPHRPTEPSLADLGISEPTPAIHEPGLPEVGEIAIFNAHTNAAIAEEAEESDAPSVYSDAAEDLSDMDGDGFLSLDAVVESPVNMTTPTFAITSPTESSTSKAPESPTLKSTKERAYRKSQLSEQSDEPEMAQGWDKAQEYWSSLSAEKKRQLEQEAREEAEESDTEIEVKPAPKPKMKKKKKVLIPAAAVAQAAPIATAGRPQSLQTNERTYMIQPGSKAGPNGHVPVAQMRSSMRIEPQNTGGDTHMRKSMRGRDSMRASLRGSAPPVEPRGSLQKKHQPMSLEIKADPTAVKKHIKNLSEASAAAAPAAAKRDVAPAPILRRKSSGDSESSFKRSRPSNDGSNFRRSMRSSTDQDRNGRPQSPPMRSSRFSLRSLSPTGSAFRRPFSSAAPPVSLSQTHMRGSMRNSADSTSSLRIPGFGKSGASKAPKQKVTPQRSSRFADSSDEEDDRPAFRSRFDSSDEDEPVARPTGMRNSMRSSALSAPVRGIPKRQGAEDGDSSDLPDSDDEKVTSPGLRLSKKRGTNGSATVPSAQGAILASGSLRRSGSGRGTIGSPTAVTTITLTRPNNSRRGSFMSILRRKKADPSAKVRKSEAESPARRDTPLERSKSDLAALRHGRPQTPKLQKRNGPSRENSATGPLPVTASPSKTVGGEDEKPFIADTDDGPALGGFANGDRPDIGTRRFTATGLADVDINGLGGKGRKKKKFGALRRMFRLDD